MTIPTPALTPADARATLTQLCRQAGGVAVWHRQYAPEVDRQTVYRWVWGTHPMSAGRRRWLAALVGTEDNPKVL